MFDEGKFVVVVLVTLLLLQGFGQQSVSFIICTETSLVQSYSRPQSNV